MTPRPVYTIPPFGNHRTKFTQRLSLNISLNHLIHLPSKAPKEPYEKLFWVDKYLGISFENN
jgi:hypothetical protein